MKNRLFQLIWIAGIGLLASMPVFSQTETNAKMVRLRVSVIDKNEKIVGALKQERFTVKEDGAEQKISYFATDEEKASVVILMDLSESVTDSAKKANVRCALKFIQKSHPDNDYSVIGFNENIVELASWKDGSDQAVRVLKDIYDAKPVKSNTRFYDAVMTGFEKLKTGVNDKKILLIFSDGADNESKESFGKVAKALKGNDVIIYSVAVLPAGSAFITSMQGQAFLDELAAISGGKIYFPQTFEDAEAAIDNVVSAVKNQYLIGYVPREPRKNKDWHSVKIKVSTPDANDKKQSLSVRTREGFFIREEN